MIVPLDRLITILRNLTLAGGVDARCVAQALDFVGCLAQLSGVLFSPNDRRVCFNEARKGTQLKDAIARDVAHYASPPRCQFTKR